MIPGEQRPASRAGPGAAAERSALCSGRGAEALRVLPSVKLQHGRGTWATAEGGVWGDGSESSFFFECVRAIARAAHLCGALLWPYPPLSLSLSLSLNARARLLRVRKVNESARVFNIAGAAAGIASLNPRGVVASCPVHLDISGQ